MAAEVLFRHDREFYCESEQGSIYGVVWLPKIDLALDEKASHSIVHNTRRLSVQAAHSQAKLAQASRSQATHTQAEPAQTTHTQVPLVVFCHELGLDHRSAAPWAQHLTRLGYAVAACDFRGGSVHPNKSEGSSRNMSVLTEVADLSAVLDAVRNWDFVDTSHIVLCGASQGGIVAALTACARPADIEALLLLYPAFSVSDGMRRMFPQLSDVPSEFDLLGWMPVGSRYVTDMWSYEPFEHIADFERPVLIIHGEDDPIVSVSYAQRALEVYRNCELNVLSGEGHGLSENAFELSCQLMTEFLSKL